MSGLNRTPGKRVYVSKRTAGSNPALSARTSPANSLSRVVRRSEPRTTQSFLLWGPDRPMATLRKNAERWTHCSGFLMLAHEYASVAPPKNSPTHAVGGCASRQVIVGRRQMSWQIHAAVKQPQNIDD